ncbi:MAG: sugar ABC transporter ATP-binding protein [Anaerolineales bacterium]|nr:sugar ABC transporter ATP-binding protein [Anaerolineales bacterium]
MTLNPSARPQLPYVRNQEDKQKLPRSPALNQVSLEFQPGEVHAIVGENGAGKSTLIKIICGIYTPDEGEVRLNGERLTLHSYSDALAKKICLVSQEIQVIPKSTIAENIMLDKLERLRRMERLTGKPSTVPPPGILTWWS